MTLPSARRLFAPSHLFFLIGLVSVRCVGILGIVCAGVLAFAFAPSALAQVTPALRDTSIVRGAEFDYDVRVVVPDSVWRRFARLDSLQFTLSFGSSRLALRRVSGGGQNAMQYAMQCPAPLVDSSFQPASGSPLGVLRVRCNQIQRPSGAAARGDTIALCQLRFVALAGADSVSRIRLAALTINNQALTIVQPSAPTPTLATITVRDTTAFAPTFAETLEQNFPNPFITETIVAFTIADLTTLRFALFGLAGDMVWESEPIFAAKGRTTLPLSFPISLPNGVYALRMTTNRGAYWRRVMVFR
jgi:hypothetical protein